MYFGGVSVKWSECECECECAESERGTMLARVDAYIPFSVMSMIAFYMYALST